VEASEYDRLYAFEERHWRSRAIRRLVHRALAGTLAEARPGRPRVLEAGCGCGYLALSLGKRMDVLGLDASPAALHYCRRRGLRQLARADVQTLPFADGSFDAAVSIDVLYHRAVADDAAALAELGRVCRPGGRVILVLAAYEWMRSSHDEVVHTARRYTTRGVRALATAVGLLPEHVTHFNAAVLPLAVARRLWRGRAPAPASDLGLPPAPLNALAGAWLALEVAAAARVGLPFGLSVFATLRKPPLEEFGSN
jgi:ubiquinone/menaquinone biosynthesis C-methylase UbiE